MPSWRDEYLSALQERDKREKVNQNLYHSCRLLERKSLLTALTSILDTKLADRTGSLQAWSATEADKSQDEPTSSPKPKDRKASRDKGAPGSPTPSVAIAKVRQDLGEAQRSRGLMETKLQSVTEELNRFKIQSSLDTKRISELAKEKAALTTGLRDRDEELKGKAKLLEVGTL